MQNIGLTELTNQTMSKELQKKINFVLQHRGWNRNVVDWYLDGKIDKMTLENCMDWHIKSIKEIGKLNVNN